MQDNLGRFWKVAQPDGNRSTRFVYYTKKSDGNAKILGELDVEPSGGVHGSRKRANGMVCGGALFGPSGSVSFQICGKCAALVDERRR